LLSLLFIGLAIRRPVMRKITSFFVLIAFVFSCVMPPHGFAQTMSAVGLMPTPGAQVALSGVFTPAHLKGMIINPVDPFKFDFIINRGDEQLTADQKQSEYPKLIKYFLASLAVPDTDQWVNLSPYEQDRIIPDNFGLTEMGRDLLAQDYLLKQISSSLTNPDTDLGKKFWDGVYAQAYEKFGTTEIPTDTFNKVWITPDKAVVYEQGNTVYVLEHHLKVMLEKDYLATQKNVQETVTANEDGTAAISQQVMKDIIIPAIEKEVNEGKNFAPLRQVYSGMLLASWYKLALKESILGKLYADQSKVKGVDQDPKSNQEIYGKYVEAFKKGVFNMIKEDVDNYTQEVIPRKYFSGGAINNEQGIMERRQKKDQGVEQRIFENAEKKDDLTKVVLQAPSETQGENQKLSPLPVSAVGKMKYKSGSEINLETASWDPVYSTLSDALESFRKWLSAADAVTVRQLMSDLLKAVAEGQSLGKDIEINKYPFQKNKGRLEVRYRGQKQFVEYRFNFNVDDLDRLARGVFYGPVFGRRSGMVKKMLGYIQKVMDGVMAYQGATGSEKADVQAGRLVLPVSAIGKIKYTSGTEYNRVTLATEGVYTTFHDGLDAFRRELNAADAETARKLMADLSKAVAEGQFLGKDLKIEDRGRILLVRYRDEQRIVEYKFGSDVRDLKWLVEGPFRGISFGQKRSVRMINKIFGYMQEAMQEQANIQSKNESRDDQILKSEDFWKQAKEVLLEVKNEEKYNKFGFEIGMFTITRNSFLRIVAPTFNRAFLGLDRKWKGLPDLFVFARGNRIIVQQGTLVSTQMDEFSANTYFRWFPKTLLNESLDNFGKKDLKDFLAKKFDEYLKVMDDYTKALDEQDKYKLVDTGEQIVTDIVKNDPKYKFVHIVSNNLFPSQRGFLQIYDYKEPKRSQLIMYVKNGTFYAGLGKIIDVTVPMDQWMSDRHVQLYSRTIFKKNAADVQEAEIKEVIEDYLKGVTTDSAELPEDLINEGINDLDNETLQAPSETQSDVAGKLGIVPGTVNSSVRNLAIVDTIKKHVKLSKGESELFESFYKKVKAQGLAKGGGEFVSPDKRYFLKVKPDTNSDEKFKSLMLEFETERYFVTEHEDGIRVQSWFVDIDEGGWASGAVRVYEITLSQDVGDLAQKNESPMLAWKSDIEGSRTVGAALKEAVMQDPRAVYYFVREIDRFLKDAQEANMLPQRIQRVADKIANASENDRIDIFGNVTAVKPVALLFLDILRAYQEKGSAADRVPFDNVLYRMRFSSAENPVTLAVKSFTGFTLEDLGRNALQALSLLGPTGKVMATWNDMFTIEMSYGDYFRDDDVYESEEDRQQTFYSAYEKAFESWKTDTEAGKRYVEQEQQQEKALKQKIAARKELKEKYKEYQNHPFVVQKDWLSVAGVESPSEFKNTLMVLASLSKEKRERVAKVFYMEFVNTFDQQERDRYGLRTIEAVQESDLTAEEQTAIQDMRSIGVFNGYHTQVAVPIVIAFYEAVFDNSEENDERDVMQKQIDLQSGASNKVAANTAASYRRDDVMREFLTRQRDILYNSQNVERGKDYDPAGLVNGGINMNSANLNMQIKRDGNGVPLPVSQQNLDNIRIDGLVPVILDIKPVGSAPLFADSGVLTPSAA
jgi:hypothetical protein